MIQRFQAFVTGITECHKYIQKIKNVEMTEFGLKGTHVMCLFYLHYYPEGLTAAQLCKLCCEDKAAISRTVAELEERGMISCPNQSGKRYRTRLRLTEAGYEAAEGIEQRARMAVEQAGEGLDDEKRAVFYEVLALIAGNLSSISRDGLKEE